MTRVKKKSPEKNEAQGFNVRLGLVVSIFILFAGALSARLFYLQIIQHEELVAQSEKQYQSSVKIYYGRGSILDRNGTTLAANIEAESVYVSPVEIFSKKEAARQLSNTLNLSFDSVLKKISSNKQFAWIKRKCDLREIDALRALNLAGVGFIVEHKRYYPKRELAANVLGFVGLDNQGLSGAELYHHELLKGFTQLKIMEKDARGRPVSAFSSMINADRGSSDVVLTLDEVIQFTAEYHLKKQVETYKAKSGLAVVMDPNTGEILALASAPQFNPNQYGSYKPAAWRNNIIGGSYEPGSIFKPIIAAAALDQGLARPQDIFFCENGSFKLGRTHIGEAANHKFGWLTLRDIISKSSNIGSIKIAQQVGEKTFYDYHVPVGAVGRKVESDLCRRVGSVDDHPDAVAVAAFDEFGDRQYDAGLRDDVVDDGHPNRRRKGRFEGVEHGLRVGDRERQVDHLQVRSRLSGRVEGGLLDAAVRGPGDEQLLALPQGEGAQDRVDAGGGVVDEGQVAAASAEEGGHLAGGRLPAGVTFGVLTATGEGGEFTQHERDGWASISQRIRSCSSRTRRGVTPTVPWLR